jgi:hypothetical protein
MNEQGELYNYDSMYQYEEEEVEENGNINEMESNKKSLDELKN